MATVDIQVPDIGDFKGVSVIELLVKPGDAVKVEQRRRAVESDKASMEIPSPQAGVVKAMKVKLGDTVSQGSVILALETADTAQATAASAGATAAPPASTAAPPASTAPPPTAAHAPPAPSPSAQPPASAASAASGSASELECDMLVLGAGPG